MATVTTTETTPTSEIPVLVAPTQTVRVPAGTLASSERRRDLALWFLAGGGVMMTVYAILALYLVTNTPHYVFYLGLASMVNIMVLFTGIAGLLVKRTLNVSRTGVVIEDHEANGSKDQ